MPLSAKQMEYLAIAWQCFDTEPKIDYAKFATFANLASPASARELLRVTKNKLRVEYGAFSSDGQKGATSPKTPRTPKKRARDDCDGAGETPGSRKKGKKNENPKGEGKKGGGKENSHTEEGPVVEREEIVKQEEVNGEGEEASFF